jgi:hypothetical protein
MSLSDDDKPSQMFLPQHIQFTCARYQRVATLGSNRGISKVQRWSELPRYGLARPDGKSASLLIIIIIIMSRDRGFEFHSRHGCRGLAPGWSPVQGVLTTVYRIRKLKSGQGPTKGCRAIIIIIIQNHPLCFILLLHGSLTFSSKTKAVTNSYIKCIFPLFIGVGVRFPTEASRPALGPNGLQFNGYWGYGSETDHSPPSYAEVKNGTAIPPLHHKPSWHFFLYMYKIIQHCIINFYAMSTFRDLLLRKTSCFKRLHIMISIYIYI